MGLIVLDAGVVIAVLDAQDVHHTAARKALTEARERGDKLVLPVSAYAECLVSPSRRGIEAVATIDGFIDALPARVEPATRKIGAMAASLRAMHGRGIRLPDALVIATAQILGADGILTTDAGWPTTVVGIEVIPAGA